jgi:transposase
MTQTDLSNTETIQAIENLIKSFDEKERKYISKIKILEEEVRLLKEKIFGKKSEKKQVYDNQLTFFDSVKDLPEQSLSDDKEIEIKPHTRKKSGRKPIPEDLPRFECIYDIDEKDKICECGCTKTCIGSEDSEQLDIIPAKIRVKKNIRLKYACKTCEGVESEGPAVVTAQMPEQLIPKCLGTPGLIAHVLVSKFVDSLPFYRQEKQFSRIGVELSRATMCNWALKTGESLEILLMMLKKEILSGPLINIDETTVQVVKEPGRSAETKSYMWVFRGGTPEKPGIIFEYHPSRAGNIASKFIAGYSGVIQTDGYSGYNFIDKLKNVTHAGCFAHARRKFHEVIKAAGKDKEKEKTGYSGQALKYISEIYKIEKEASDQSLTGEALYNLRQEKAKPLLKEFKEWLDALADITPPKGLLGKAVNYTLKQWHRLSAYADTSCTTPDNNLAENAIRPFVVGRKNWLFSYTPEGATASAAIYSIIETAKANKIEPYWYLRNLITKLPDAMTEDDYRSLLPQYIDVKELPDIESIS